MASLKCYESSKKYTSEGYSGGSMEQKVPGKGNWAFKADKHESSYQMGFANEMGRTSGYGSGLTHGSHMSNGMGGLQHCGGGKLTVHGTSQAHDFGHGPTHRFGNEMGQVQVYGPGRIQGNHFNNGVGPIQGYGQGKPTGYKVTETKTHEFTKIETHSSNSNAGHCYGGTHGSGFGRHGPRHNKGDHPRRGILRRIKDGISGHNSCSDSDSDSECEMYEKKKVWVNKGL
ncbi:hypothetical protein SLA2020_496590 [Shorea laevis]